MLPPKRMHAMEVAAAAAGDGGDGGANSSGTSRSLASLPMAPTFHPTAQEWNANPILYIEQIRPLAERAGICKIVPPASWKPPLSILPSCKFHSRVQNITLLDGVTRIRRAFDLAVRKYRFSLRLPRLPGDVDWFAVFRHVKQLGGRQAVVDWQAVGCTRDEYESALGHYEDLVLRGLRADPQPSPAGNEGENDDDDERAKCISAVMRAQESVQRAAAAQMAGDIAANLRSLPQSSSAGKVAPGVRLWKYFDDIGAACQGTIRGVVKDPGSGNAHWRVTYVDARTGKETMSYDEDQSELNLALVSGSTAEEATEAYLRGVCQVCARAHLTATLCRCVECAGRYHRSCLSDTEQPLGEQFDWFCAQCSNNPMAEAEASLLNDFGFDDGPDFTLEEYRAHDEAFRSAFVAASARDGAALNTPQDWNAAFWRLVRNQRPATMRECRDVSVVYANDIDTAEVGSGFPTAARLRRQAARMDKMTPAARQQLDEYAQSPWNLNNLPTAHGSLLQYIQADISGIVVPWLYVGMTLSAFCWHVEDHYFSSINYLHKGEPKSWWGVPGDSAHAFEAAARATAPELFSARPDLLQGIVTMFAPWELGGVPACHALQREGEFIVTFPRAYHCGFNHGLNIAEAVNFAGRSWLPWGLQAVDAYASLGKSPVISHEALMLTIAAKCVADAEFLSTAQQLVGPLRELIAREQELRVKPGLEWSTETAPPALVTAASVSVKRAKGARQRYALDMGRLSALANAFESIPRCSQCQRFCALSHAVASDGVVYCLAHASAAAAVATCFASHSMESLQLILDGVVERATLTSRVYERIHRVLHDVRQPDDLLGPECAGGEPLAGTMLECPSLALAMRRLPLRTARKLVDLARQAQLPVAREVAVLDAAEETLNRVEALVPLRATRGTSPATLEQLRAGAQELQALPVLPDGNVLQRLRAEIASADEWQAKARAAVAEGNWPLNALEALAAEAKFDMPERTTLDRVVRRARWMARATRLLEAFGDDVLGEAQALLESAPEHTANMQAKLRQFVVDTQALAVDVAAIFDVDVLPNRLFEVFAVAGPRLPVEMHEKLRKHVGTVKQWTHRAEEALKQTVVDPDAVAKLLALRSALKIAPDFEVAAKLQALQTRLDDLLAQTRVAFFGKDEGPTWSLLQATLEAAWERVDFPQRTAIGVATGQCTCMQPNTPGRVLVQCEGACGQWFHPECQKLNVNALPEHFECEACTAARVLHCICRRPTFGGEVMIACDRCEDRWFHPQCLGITKSKLAKMGEFLCPVCTRAEGTPLACVCQQPIVVGSAPTVTCEQCAKVFHCPCVSVTDKAVIESYVCAPCCDALDMPVAEGGKRGFEVKLKTLRAELAKGTVKRPLVAQMDKLVQGPPRVPLTALLEDAVDKARAWAATVSARAQPCPVCQAPSLVACRAVDLWPLLDATVKLRVHPPENAVAALEGELLLRHVAKAVPTARPRLSEVRALWGLTGRNAMVAAYAAGLDAHKPGCSLVPGLRANLDRFAALGAFEKRFSVALRKAAAAAKAEARDKPVGDARELLAKGGEVFDLGESMAAQVKALLE